MARAERSETALRSNDPKGEARGRVILKRRNRLSGDILRWIKEVPENVFQAL